MPQFAIASQMGWNERCLGTDMGWTDNPKPADLLMNSGGEFLFPSCFLSLRLVVEFPQQEVTYGTT